MSTSATQEPPKAQILGCGCVLRLADRRTLAVCPAHSGQATAAWQVAQR